jgi:signal transduction histidine kinase
VIQRIRRIQPTWAAALFYAGLALIFYAPLLLGWRTFPDGDFTHHFLPFSLFQQSEWLAGRFLPVWNPYTYSGHPFLADVQSAVFYPLGDLLLLITLPFSSPGARLYFLQLEAVIHVALAGFFTFLLVRELSGSRRSALLSGVLFAFSGYLTGYPPLQLAILRTVIWLPLILWLLTRAFADPRRWRLWIGAILAYAVALLAGHPQSFLHVSYAVLAWILFLFLSQRSRLSEESEEAKRRRRKRGGS